jgi:threonyl-tRNA synthetase
LTSWRSAVRVSYIPMFPHQIPNAYAVEILGVALVELFPGIELIESSLTDHGFCFTALFPQGRHPEMIPLIEEQMRRLMKEEIQFQKMEMMRENAAQFLESLEQPILAERALESSDQTLHLIRYGHYANFPPVVPEVFPVEHAPLQIKVMQVEEKGEELTIFGVAFANKDDLKAFVKLREKDKKERPEGAAQKRGWLTEEGYLLPSGIAQLAPLKAIWSKALTSKGLTEVMTQSLADEDLEDSHLILAQRFTAGIGEWATGENMMDLQTILASSAQANALCISSLQFIVETAKILDLGIEWIAEFQQSPYVQGKEWSLGVSCLKQALKTLALTYEENLQPPQVLEPTLTGVVVDAYGNRWRLPFISISFSREKQRARLRFSLLGPIRRFLALKAETKPVL